MMTRDCHGFARDIFGLDENPCRAFGNHKRIHAASTDNLPYADWRFQNFAPVCAHPTGVLWLLRALLRSRRPPLRSVLGGLRPHFFPEVPRPCTATFMAVNSRQGGGFLFYGASEVPFQASSAIKV
jgi:hypothetical protein